MQHTSPEEAKAILSGLQEQLVPQQLADHLQRHRPCPCCRRPRTLKGYHPLRFRSAFGDIELRSPRWYECECEGRPAKAIFSALNKILTTHTAPALEFLQAKWAAHLSFAAAADLLHDVLPVDSCLNGETIRMHVFATAERLEAELGPEQFAFDAGCQYEIEASPEPGPPVTVGLDGGYIRGRERRPGATGCFEVMAGKSIPEEGSAKVFLSDGGDTVREWAKPTLVHRTPPTSGYFPCWGGCVRSHEPDGRANAAIARTAAPEDHFGVHIADFLVRGRITWDENEDGRLPMLVIDGRDISWQQFGRMVMGFEGWQFKFEIRDRSEEV